MNLSFPEYVKKLRAHRGLSEEIETKMSTTYRNIITLNGYEFDVAKSALQKYIRRSNVRKAQYIACELDVFRFFPEGKASWTNFYNRLRVVALEDIGIACPQIVTVIDELFEDWDTTNQKLSVNMLKAVKIMCMCPHTRFYSHLRAYLKTRKPDQNVPVYIHPLGDDEKLRESVDNLVWCLENKDTNAWFWIEQILREEKLVEKHEGSIRPGFLIFEILRHFTNDPILDTCEKWYKTLKVKEQFLCCMHPVYTYILGVESFPLNTDFPQDFKPYNSCLSNKLIELDDYVYDMHTRVGRSIKRDSADFAIEGSLVAYENREICGMKIYKKLAWEYEIGKIAQGTVDFESDAFVLKARAQLICSAVRPDTYFAKNRFGQNVVVKGPYLNKESAMMPFKIQSVFRLFSGINNIDVNVKILFPNMFDGEINPVTPFGCRTKVSLDKAYYFVVMEDLMNQDEYPTIEKESKMWPKTMVVDFEKVFEDGSMGFGYASQMSEEALLSFVLQLSIRYAFKIGDFAARNFLRIGDKVYNLDTEGIDVGAGIRFSKKEIDLLKAFLTEHKDQYDEYLRSWIENEHVWALVKVTLGKDVRGELESLLENPEVMFA